MYAATLHMTLFSSHVWIRQSGTAACGVGTQGWLSCQQKEAGQEELDEENSRPEEHKRAGGNVSGAGAARLIGRGDRVIHARTGRNLA